MLDTTIARGLLSILGAFMIAMTAGITFLWGVINIYLASYFHIVHSSSITTNLVNIIFPLMFIGQVIFLYQAITIPVGARFLRKFKSRSCCFILSIILSCLIYMSSLTTNFFYFTIIFGVLVSLVLGSLYITPISHCYKYFPNHRSVITGLIIAGNGIGTMIFAILSIKVINPNNQKLNSQNYFSQSVALKFPSYLRYMSIIIMLLAAIGSLLLLELLPGMKPFKIEGEQNRGNIEMMDLQFTIPNQQTKQQQKNPFQTFYGVQNNVYLNMNIVKPDRFSTHSNSYYDPYDYSIEYGQQYNYKIKQNQSIKKFQIQNQCPQVRFAPKTFVFWTIFITIMTGIFIQSGTNFGMLIISSYKVYSIRYIENDINLTWIGVLGAFSNGISRFVWAFALSKFQFKNLYLVMSIFNIFLAITLDFCIKKYPFLFFLYVALISFIYGGYFGIFPSLVTKVFGSRYSSQIYGLIYFSFACTNIGMYVLLMTVVPLFGYPFLFYLQGGILIASILFSRMIKQDYEWVQQIRKYNEQQRLLAH